MKKRKRKKIKLFHYIIIFLVLYLTFSFVKQQININKLKSEKEIKENEIEKLIVEVEDITKQVDEFQVSQLEEYINLIDSKKELDALDSKNEEEYKNIIEQINIIEQKLKSSNIINYIENIARNKYKMVKDNELLFIDKNKLDDNNNDIKNK